MKKITLLSILAISITSFAQQKSTGNITLSTNMTANLTLNNTTSKATLTLTGPSDRWFALQFGSFAVGDGMASGEDLVYANGTTLVDAKHNGVGSAPTTDATNNWTVTSNTVDTNTSIRTVIAERAFATGDTNDYTFNYANTSIDFAWARRSSAGYGMNNHGGANRGYMVSQVMNTLGVEDFSLKASSIYPNPSNGNFNIDTKSGLDIINVYSQLGALVQTIEVKDKSNSVELSLKNLQRGIYLVELKNGSDKSWKKIIIE